MWGGPPGLPSSTQSPEGRRTHKRRGYPGPPHYMAVTRSQTAQRVDARRPRGSRFAWRRAEFVWTVAAGLLVGAGLFQVYKAKSQPFEDIANGIAAKRLLDLNALSAREELLSVLARSPDPMFPDPAE